MPSTAPGPKKKARVSTDRFGDGVDWAPGVRFKLV